MEEVNLDEVPAEESGIRNECKKRNESTIRNTSECHKGVFARRITHNIKKGVQQNDNLKPFYEHIFHFGLQKTYEGYSDSKYPFSDTSTPHCVEQTKQPRKVIIVGAGMAGLSAAYELRRAGHSVQILEMTQRAGGRVKTFGERDGFAEGLYVDVSKRSLPKLDTPGILSMSMLNAFTAGAMRLPNKVNEKHKIHYITDHYVRTFKLKILPFKNADKNTLLKFYDMKPMTLTEWNGSDDGYTNFCMVWPKWNQKIETLTPRINNIEEYYDRTLQPIKEQLTSRLSKVVTYEESDKVWTSWIEAWSQFSVVGYLRSHKSEVLRKLADHSEFHDEIEKSDLENFIPWPEEAITAYSVFTYMEELNQSLVQFLRSKLGHLCSDEMHMIEGGMSKLPESFYEELKENVTFNVTVKGIWFQPEGEDPKVTVKGYYSTSCHPCEFEGEAVIVTAPIHLIRQMKIEVMKPETASYKNDIVSSIYRGIEDIWCGPATKIMIQTKTRFWASNLDESKNITGGSTKTNLPIGQIYYMPPPENGSEKGLLLAYTWKSEALQFGALAPDAAIQEAIRQIAEIHPEIRENFEVGAVQAWYNEPSAQGAYVLLKPHQYRNVERLMYYPIYNVFFAGDGISFVPGWIEGALESGLRAAYQFHSRNEEDKLSHLLQQ